MTTGELLISLLIIVAVLGAAWRGGQRNPVGTGRLARRMDQLELKVALHGERLDGMEKAMLAIAEKVSDVDRKLGTLDTGIQALRVEVAGDRGITQRTWDAVDRLQNYFIEDAFERRRDSK